MCYSPTGPQSYTWVPWARYVQNSEAFEKYKITSVDFGAAPRMVKCFSTIFEYLHQENLSVFRNLGL